MYISCPIQNLNLWKCCHNLLRCSICICICFADCNKDFTLLPRPTIQIKVKLNSSQSLLSGKLQEKTEWNQGGESVPWTPSIISPDKMEVSRVCLKFPNFWPTKTITFSMFHMSPMLQKRLQGVIVDFSVQVSPVEAHLESEWVVRGGWSFTFGSYVMLTARQKNPSTY